MEKQQNVETFQNDHITIKAKRGPQCHVTLDIEVSPRAAEAAYLKAVKEVSKEVSIPGFRKGKAPAHMVADTFGKSIDKQFYDIAIDTAVKEAINLSKIYPYDKNKFEGFKLHHLSRDKGGHLTVSYSSHPNIPQINLKDLPAFNMPAEPVDEKQLEKITEQLRFYHALWTPVTDRPAQEGDFVVLDIVTATQPSREVCKEKTFKLVEGEVADWMYRALIGVSPGQTIEAMTEKKPTSCSTGCSDPEHHHEHEHEEAFTPILCKITLQSISTPTLPVIDEDFAKKMGCASLEEFAAKTQEYAESMAKSRQLGNMRNAMFNYLREHYPFDVPGLLVTNEVKDYVQSCIDDLSPEEKTDEALKLIEQESQVLEEEIKKRVYIEYLVGQLASQYNLKVTQQEISQELMRELIQNQAYQDAANFEKNSEIVAQRLARDKLIEKTLDFLIENAGKENA